MSVGQLAHPAHAPHAHRRLLIVTLGAAAVLAVVILALAIRPTLPTTTQPAPVAHAVTHSIPGAFYVSPGNLAPLGVVHAAAPVPGAFYVSPGNLAPLGVLAPATVKAVSYTVPGAFYVSPGSLAPLGVVHAVAPVPGAFYLSPGNLAPIGVVAPAVGG